MRKIAANKNYRIAKRASEAEAKKTLGKMVGTIQNNVAEGLTEYGAPETKGFGLNYKFLVNLENLSSEITVDHAENLELTEFVVDKFDAEKDKEENILAFEILSDIYANFGLPIKVMPPEYDSGEYDFDI